MFGMCGRRYHLRYRSGASLFIYDAGGFYVTFSLHGPGWGPDSMYSVTSMPYTFMQNELTNPNVVTIDSRLYDIASEDR